MSNHTAIRFIASLYSLSRFCGRLMAGFPIESSQGFSPKSASESLHAELAKFWVGQSHCSGADSVGVAVARLILEPLSNIYHTPQTHIN